jgi:hypothetical protein
LVLKYARSQNLKASLHPYEMLLRPSKDPIKRKIHGVKVNKPKSEDYIIKAASIHKERNS